MQKSIAMVFFHQMISDCTPSPVEKPSHWNSLWTSMTVMNYSLFHKSRLFSSRFWPHLKQASFIEAAGEVAKIILSFKLNHNKEFSLLKSVKHTWTVMKNTKQLIWLTECLISFITQQPSSTFKSMSSSVRTVAIPSTAAKEFSPMDVERGEIPRKKNRQKWASWIISFAIVFNLEFWSTAVIRGTVKLVYNNHPRIPVVNRWSLFMGKFMLWRLKTGLQNGGCCRLVVVSSDLTVLAIAYFWPLYLNLTQILFYQFET